MLLASLFVLDAYFADHEAGLRFDAVPDRPLQHGCGFENAVRLRAGREGFAGWLMSRFTRRSRPAPPIIADPPRQHLSGWELGLY